MKKITKHRELIKMKLLPKIMKKMKPKKQIIHNLLFFIYYGKIILVSKNENKYY